MRFIYSPDNGILLYSRGRIFLIFSHYNYFLDAGGHQGDTTVTFDEILLDLDFGETWGSSHSLIQSATFDNDYFWTATLSDAYPEGIKVIYTSKKHFTKQYDSINKKYSYTKYNQTTYCKNRFFIHINTSINILSKSNHYLSFLLVY